MKVRRNNKLAHSLPQLQNLVKRDPTSYNDEVKFENQLKSIMILQITNCI